MATLKERIAMEMKEALRGGEKLRLGTLRMLSAAIKNREVELGRELDDEDVIEMAQREVKKRREAAEAFEAGGRPELAEKERQEQAVLDDYLPEALGEGEVRDLVEEAIAATGAQGPRDMGKVMAFVMGKAKGRIDGAAVSSMVRERLGPS